MTDKAKAHISVCICTYKRPDMLGRLLRALGEQDTRGRFTYSVVISDNDADASGKEVATQFQASSTVPLNYYQEPRQNIALARNKAIAGATGNYIAFIDDDEFPTKDWLFLMLKTCEEYGCDGVLGPVKPYFDVQPPKWVLKGRFFDRPTHQTGFVVPGSEGRTGNLLFKTEILEGDTQPFRAEYGSGGEDRDFFARMLGKGRVFIWCDEAAVYETVPPVRWQRSFMLKRALLRGKVDLVDPSARLKNLLKAAIAVPVYSLALPFLVLFGHHMVMKFLIRLFDHLGRLLAFVGVDPVKEKYVTG